LSLSAIQALLFVNIFDMSNFNSFSFKFNSCFIQINDIKLSAI